MEVSLLDEVQGAQFGDQRLDRRLGKVIEELGAHPNLSIPAATDSRAEMEGAYRFFDNDKASPEKILQPHFDATRDRISQTDFALLVQDTLADAELHCCLFDHCLASNVPLSSWSRVP